MLKLWKLRVPRNRNSNFYPMLLGVLKDQEEEAQKLVIQRWQKSYPPLKRYHHDRYRFYFTYFKYEREIA